MDDLIGTEIKGNDLRQADSAITDLAGVYDPQAVALVNLEMWTYFIALKTIPWLKESLKKIDNL